MGGLCGRGKKDWMVSAMARASLRAEAWMMRRKERARSATSSDSLWGRTGMPQMWVMSGESDGDGVSGSG